MKNSKNQFLHIGPDYAISGDSVCLTLYKRRITQKGTEQWDPVGYYNAGRYDHVLRRMVEQEISGLDTLEKIVKVVDGLKEHIDDLFQKSLQTPSQAADKDFLS